MEDREVRSGIRKALDQRLHQATRGLAKDLLAEEHALLAHTRREVFNDNYSSPGNNNRRCTEKVRFRN